ncbi:MAG: zinc ribbon domain-containing protein [Firmicutes bacterium]|nr:zinc ribbon domain-containing protein [Bacillota bacterium]
MNNNLIFSTIPFIIAIIVIAVFIFVFSMMISPKLRAKFMSRQIKSLKYMTDFSKEDLENISSNLGEVSINSTKNILDKNEDKIKDITEKTAEMSSIKIEKIARAIKKGLTENNIFCKHCGRSISTDSKFCKYCGKEV